MRVLTLSTEFKSSSAVREALVIRVTLTSPGDTLVIDNWRMLHGRSAVPRDGLQRHVERAYLGKLL